MPEEKFYVKDYMSSDLITLYDDEPIKKALEMFDAKVFRHIPIINSEKKLVGILSDRDVRSATVALDFLEEAFKQEKSDIQIRDVMTINPATISSSDVLKDAAKRMLSLTIGAMPVVDRDELKGIITYTDVLKAFIELCN